MQVPSQSTRSRSTGPQETGTLYNSLHPELDPAAYVPKCPTIQSSAPHFISPTSLHSTTPLFADRHGRKRTSFNGQEICNNFNSSRSCNRSNCPYQHVCILCKGKDHSAVTCTQSNKTKPKNSTQPSSTRKEDK